MNDADHTTMREAARAMARDPQPVYRLMREAMPAVEIIDSPIGPMGLVAHRRDIEEALRHPEVFSSTESVNLQNVRPLIPLNVDPPDHRRYRRILDPLFAPRAVAGLEAQVRELANRLMDRFSGEREIDFAASFSVPLPSQVFLTLLGLPAEELATFLAMKDGIIRPQHVVGTTSNHPEAVAHQRRTAESIYQYFERLLEARTAEPRDDLVTRLLHSELDGERLSREEILDITFLLLIAGLDTVTASLECMFAFLARNPAHRRQIVDNPALVPAAVEELLRYETPVIGVPRITTRPTRLGGCPVPARHVVTLLLGAANSDEAEWSDGEVVRFDRYPNRHLAFGGGIHRCLGSHLARQELRVALREWHLRYPEYSIRAGAELAYTTGIRSVEHFPMVLGD